MRPAISNRIRSVLVPSRRLAMAMAVIVAPLGLVAVAGGPAGAVTAPFCGETLTANVTFYADLDCSAYATGPALIVGASGITINLNHHRLIGPGGAAATNGIKIGADPSVSYANVTVENGAVDDFNIDVAVYAAHLLLLTGLTLGVDGVDNSNGVVANHVTGGTISAVTVADAYLGISVAASSQVTVSGSSAIDGTFGYYDFDGQSDSFTSDEASGDTYGFYSQDTSGGLFLLDQANTNSDGFYIGTNGGGANTLRANTANDNTYNGIDLIDNDNATSGSSGPDSVVTFNTVDDNGADGINDTCSLYQSITYNTAISNNHDGIESAGCPNGHEVVSNNIADDNFVDGIEAENPAAYTVNQNTTNSNASSGIYLEGNGSPSNVTTASYNFADDNGDDGLLADAPAPGLQNIAQFDTPTGCVNFVCEYLS